MKVAVIYSDNRGRYIADGFRNFCDVIEINLSAVALTQLQKMLSAAISFHVNRRDWKNDFYRNPLAVFFRRKNGNNIIRKVGERVDAVLQFGLMNTYSYSLLGTGNVFYYQDGAYDKHSKLWSIKRYSKSFYLMQKRAFDNATGIFTFSNWAKQQHINEYYQPEEKVVAVGWGPCIPVSHEPIKVREKVRRLLFIGKPGKWKGLSVLLSAFQIIQKNYQNVALDVIGVDENDIDGPNIQGVFYQGRLSPEDVITFLKRADLFILPSLYERAGHVTVEAMWYGCPVVVTDTCGAPEPVLAGNCGLVVEPGNSESLQHVITTIMEKRETISKFSRSAMREARENWSWDAVCGRMVEHMESFVRANR